MEKKMGDDYLIGCLFWNDENILELNSGDGCTML